MMKSLEVERVRSRAAGDRDSDTIIDLRTALEIEREIRNGIAGKASKIYSCQSNCLNMHLNEYRHDPKLCFTLFAPFSSSI